MSWLNNLFDKTGPDATGTDLNLLYPSRVIVHTADLLEVGLPNLGMLVVGMAYLMALQRLLSADLTNS